MIVLPVDDGDVDRSAAERHGGLQPAEAGTDDDDVRSLLRHAELALAGCHRTCRRLALAPHSTNFKASFMPSHKLLLLAGDGIGPEVMAEVKRLLDFLSKSRI